MKTLFIKESVLREMIEDSERTTEECCGFLFGQAGATNLMITKSLTVSNSNEANKFTNFEISARDYIKAECEGERDNKVLLGVYHSHPNYPATPSEYDQIAAQPNFSYVILSVMNKKFAGMRSWKLDSNSQLKEQKILRANTQ